MVLLAGMMMGAFKGAKWFSVSVSLVFPAVIFGMARGAKVELLKGTEAEKEKGKGWLIVDDLVDTGVTARAVRALLREASRAVDENAPDADALCNMVKVFASEEIRAAVERFRAARNCLPEYLANAHKASSVE